MKKYTYHILATLVALLMLSACDSYLDIKPVGSVIPETLSEYRALMTKAYSRIPSSRGLASFASDEVKLNTEDYNYKNYYELYDWSSKITQSSSVNFDFDWADYYEVIFYCNNIIEAKDDITKGSAQDIDQLVGEAYLLRAYCHFNLVNLFGTPYTQSGGPESLAVPLILKNDLEVVPSRSSIATIYTQILSDIATAKKMVTTQSYDASYTYRFGTLSLLAFEARVHLYMGNWADAYTASEEVLAIKSELEDYNSAASTLANEYTSVENIMALENNMNSTYTNVGYASDALIAQYSDGDLRKDRYFDTDRASIKSGEDKFKTTFRTAAIYLTDAEAAAHIKGQLSTAKTRLLALLAKRYTPAAYALKASAIQAMDQATFIEELANERMRELAFEGHRWFDLRRTTRPAMERLLDDKTYQLQHDDARWAFAIPEAAIESNPKLND